MPNRYAQLLANPSGVTVTPLAGDASGRRYARWRHPAFGNMIHMDARDDRAGGMKDFIKIGSHLRNLSISAPRILAATHSDLLLEDLGDDLFAAFLTKNREKETELYIVSADVLVEIQKADAPRGVPLLNSKFMANAIAPAFDSYLAIATGKSDPKVKNAVSSELEKALERTFPSSPRLLLRDYHAENLLWLPDREDTARVGVLDFQDAHVGHPAYDLVSLLEDARRDVSEQTRETVIAHFLYESKLDREYFMSGFHAQAAQRNLRILGVLANLSFAKRKHRYLEFLPRVWAHLMRDLEHPTLENVRKIVVDTFPEPDQCTLVRLEGPDA